MKNVKAEHTFWTKDGKPIKNLPELARELAAMPADTYAHHTNNRNDFATWTEHCLQEQQLANALRNAPSKPHAHQAVEQHIRQLTRAPAQTMRTATKRKNAPKKAKKKMKARKQPRIVKTGNTTPLRLSHPPQRHISKHKTTLNLTHHKKPQKIYVREPQKHYNTIALASYITLGIVFGAAITILIITFL